MVLERDRLEAAAAVARRLLGGGEVAVEVAGGGGNSRLYRVRAGGRSYALKAYPRPVDDPRDRLGAEFEALRFLAGTPLAGQVPAAVAEDRAEGFGLYSWVEGSPVGRPSPGDVEALAAFARELHALRGREAAAALRPASEACPSGAAILAQIDRRLAALEAVDNPVLAAFLAEELQPAYRAARERAFNGRRAEAELPRALWTLSPSDFGFHNALRRPEGGLVFLDFEYFGWDDPVKLCADVAWHPGMALEEGEFTRFLRALVPVYGTDPDFEARLGAFLPLYGVRWIAIILSEFLPQRWEQRVFAGAATEWAAAKARQLAKAQAYVRRLHFSGPGAEP